MLGNLLTDADETFQGVWDLLILDDGITSSKYLEKKALLRILGKFLKALGCSVC